jgi:hypothetical protein
MVVLHRLEVLRPMEQTQLRASATMALPQHATHLTSLHMQPELLISRAHILPEPGTLPHLISLHMQPELLTSRPRISPLLTPHLMQLPMPLLTGADDESGHVTLRTYGHYPGG